LLAEYKAEPQADFFEEGTFVRSTNPVYLELGIGRIQKVRGPQAKVEFNPYFSDYTSRPDHTVARGDGG